MNATKILNFPKLFTPSPFQKSLPSQSHFPNQSRLEHFRGPERTTVNHIHSLPTLPRIRSSSSGQSSSSKDSEVQQPPVTPPDTVEIRFRRGSRKRRQQSSSDEPAKKGGGEAQVKKNWEEMNLSEKAVDLYMGERGFLFWVNKFAYASIFIVIGGWILFRFVGPSLNLYQLDSPPLAPDSMFKGS